MGILGSLLGLSGRDLYLCLQEVLGLFLKGEKTALTKALARGVLHDYLLLGRATLLEVCWLTVFAGWQMVQEL